MITDIIKNLFLFVVFIALQVIVLNNINLGGYINPYLYVMYVLLLPKATPKWLVLIICFFLGLSIDMFTNTEGLHAFACVFMGYVRYHILRVLTSREDQEDMTIRSNPLGWVMVYSAILVFSHHIVLFYMEAFRFGEFFGTLFRALLSTILTLLLILLTQYLFFYKSKLNRL